MRQGPLVLSRLSQHHVLVQEQLRMLVVVGALHLVRTERVKDTISHLVVFQQVIAHCEADPRGSLSGPQHKQLVTGVLQGRR